MVVIESSQVQKDVDITDGAAKVNNAELTWSRTSPNTIRTQRVAPTTYKATVDPSNAKAAKVAEQHIDTTNSILSAREEFHNCWDPNDERC
jgi:hypothetical protein